MIRTHLNYVLLLCWTNGLHHSPSIKVSVFDLFFLNPSLFFSSVAIFTLKPCRLLNGCSRTAEFLPKCPRPLTPAPSPPTPTTPETKKKAVVSYCGSLVGTVAANYPTTPKQLNCDQVFIRDFVPSAIAFLLKRESEIVRNFLLHTLQLQALYYSALWRTREINAITDTSKNLVHAIDNRLGALSFYIREYNWVDTKKINEIYHYKTEEYSHDAINKFNNIYQGKIPSWLVDWIPETGGYLIGNLQPAHMDFRFFSLGNFWAIVSSLTIPRQTESILNVIEDKWDDLVADMPLKYATLL